MSIAGIEMIDYPTSDRTLTPEQAREAAATEQRIFGFVIQGVTPDGRSRILLGETWHWIVPEAAR